MVHGEAVQKPWQLGRRKVEPAGRLRERLHAGGQGSRYGAVEKEIGQAMEGRNKIYQLIHPQHFQRDTSGW